jgi:muramoyltetrapeptide carboxypeptidase
LQGGDRVAQFCDRRFHRQVKSEPSPAAGHDIVKRPRALGPGARIALVAPAGPVHPERIERSVAQCRGLGLEPLVFPSAGARQAYLAGSDADRLADLQAAFDDPAIDGVWALRGGYGTLRILDRLDLNRQRHAPIPFIGFSDNTTLHMRHVSMGIISFHGPHPGTPLPPQSLEFFRRVLFSPEAPGPLPVRDDDPPPRTLVGGRAEAPLVGGNLAMLAALCGSRDAISARQSILFIEDVGEPAYRVDRMLTQLARSGALEGVVGLAIGRFTEAPERGDQEVDALLRDFSERIGVPAVADLPFGHVSHNCTLPVGGVALLDGDAAQLTLLEPAVEGTSSA